MVLLIAAIAVMSPKSGGIGLDLLKKRLVTETSASDKVSINEAASEEGKP